MPYATIDIKHEKISPTENGLDKIVILFSANAGISPSDLKNVASGGAEDSNWYARMERGGTGNFAYIERIITFVIYSFNFLIG
mgnify:CR=1 FL=1